MLTRRSFLATGVAAAGALAGSACGWPGQGFGLAAPTSGVLTYWNLFGGGDGVVDTSIKPEALTTVLPLTWLPGSYTLDAYWQVLTGSAILHWYVNSTITSAIITVSTVVVASMAGYVLSRVPFRGRGVVLWVILAGIMVPAQVLIVPLFLEVDAMHLVNTYWAVVLPQVATPIAVFIFKQFFEASRATWRTPPESTARAGSGSTAASGCRFPGRPSRRWRSSRSCGRGTTSCGR